MNKVLTLREAIARDIRDGMAIAMGCALESLIPFAAGYEIIRQRRKDLTLIAPISDIQFDQIIGAACARRVVASWVGNVAAGLGHNYRRAMEEGFPGPLEVEEHSNFTLALGLKAAAMGLPFLPARTARGSDFARDRHYAEVHCPFTHEKLLAVRAIRPDLTILHVQRADQEGNAHAWGNFGVLREAAFAAKKVLLTCDEIVDHEVILSDPNRTVVPGFLVSSVVHLPFGSHPSPTQGYSRRDDDFYFAYHRESRTREGFERWLQDWVLGVADHQEYLARLGEHRLGGLRPEGNHYSPSVSFNY
jgi:glutaconate CoA-transferase, subunit A